MAEYLAMLDPAVPDILNAVVEKAKSGDLTAARLVLDRLYPARDAALSDLHQDIDELRDLVNRKAAA